MPDRQPPVMRAATTGERVTDRIRDFYEGASAQPLGMLADLLGLSDLRGVADSFADPDAANRVKHGAGPRRVPRIPAASERRFGELLGKFGGKGKGEPVPGGQPRRQPGVHASTVAPGSRIPSGSQNGLSDELKIPRFRSEHGTFVKHQGEWWRLKPNASDVKNVTLEKLPSGSELAEGAEPIVQATKTLTIDQLIEGVRRAKGAVDPKR